MVYMHLMNPSSSSGQASSQDRFDTFMTVIYQLQEISLYIFFFKNTVVFFFGFFLQSRCDT